MDVEKKSDEDSVFLIDIKEWIGYGYINKKEGSGTGMGKREILFFYRCLSF